MSEGAGGPLVARYPRSVILFFLVLTAAAAFFIRDFRVDASADTLLMKDNRLYVQTRVMSQRYSPDEFVLAAYRPHIGDIFSPASRQALESMSRAFLEMDRVASVTSILNVPLLSAMESMPTDLDADQWTWENRDYTQEELRRTFTQHPIYTGQLVNSELSATALQIVFREEPRLAALDRELLALERQALDGELDRAQRERRESLEASLDRLRENLNRRRAAEIDEIYGIAEAHEAEADIFLGGTHVLARHLIDIIKHDLAVFGVTIALIVGALLLALFRDLRWALTPMLCCAVSVTLTMGLFGLLGMKATVISANFIALQLILTLALVIHLIVQYQVLAREGASADHHELLRLTLREKTAPCFQAGLTTSVGFGSLLFSGIQPVVSFGWMMIVAMAVSIFVSLLLFPAILALSNKVLPHRKPPLFGPVVGFFQRASRRRPGLVLGAGALLAVLSVGGMALLEVENSFIDYFRDSTRVHRELSFIDREMGGSTPLDIIYRPAGEEAAEGLVASATDIDSLQKIQASLASSPAVGSLMSVVNFTELARQINGGRPLTEYELNSLYVMLDEQVRERLVGAYLDAGRGEFRISARIRDSLEDFDRAAFLEGTRQALAEVGVEEEEYLLTNLFVLYQDILQRLYRSQILTLGLVYLALGVVLLAIFRSPRIAAVALAPNILSTFFVLGVMGWLSIPLDLMTITIAAIAMGIAVDDTIHFVHRFRREGHRGEGRREAIAAAFDSVGHAMLATSVIIALGFSVLIFSDFVPSVLFGLLTAVAMLIAFVANATVLPVLLKGGARGEQR